MPPLEPPTAGGRRQTDPPGTRILVVDDDPTILIVLCEMLELEGYEVLRAATGLEGLTVAWNIPVDLIVLDVMLPGMSGIKVAAALKADESTANVPILLLTANIEGAADGLAAGAESYLRKPFDHDELLKNITRLLGRGARTSSGDRETEKGGTP